MGFWNEVRKVYDTPSKLSGKGMFWLTKKWSGSDKNAAAGARIGEVAGSAVSGDPLGFQQRLKGSDFNMSDTSYRKGRQAGDWIGAIAGSYGIGSTIAGGAGGGAAAGGEGAAAGSGGGAGAGGAGGFSEAGIGDYLAAEGAGEGAGVAAPSAGFNWQGLLKNAAGKSGQGYQQGAALSLPSLIAQEQVAEAARRSQEMLGGDTDLVNYMAQMQMRNNIRRAG